MADVVSTTNMISPHISSIVTFLSASGGLGTTAMGLVDASKAFLGGASNFGFDKIREGLKAFLLPDDTQGVPFKRTKVLQTLKANWLNGVAKADQKAIAKHLFIFSLPQQVPRGWPRPP